MISAGLLTSALLIFVIKNDILDEFIIVLLYVLDFKLMVNVIYHFCALLSKCTVTVKPSCFRMMSGIVCFVHKHV